MEQQKTLETVEMWHDVFRYEDGVLYWKPRKNVSRYEKIWNKRYAGTAAGTMHHSGYIHMKVNYKMRLAHRIIYEMHYGKIPNDMQIDHINTVKHDNRIENLQLVTHKQNQQRRTDGVGFTWHKASQKYQAQKKFNKKMHHIGLYGTPGGAYIACKMFFITQGEKV